MTTEPDAARHGFATLVRVAGWMAITITSFVAMAISARALSGSMSVFEMLCLRSIVGVVIVAVIIVITRPARVISRRPLLQTCRNVVHFAGQYAWTIGVLALPLAEVFALEFTVPVWAALFAVVFLREKMSLPRLVAVVGGFAGILIVVRPGAALLDPMTFVVLGAAMCFAGSVLMVKSLTRGDSVLTILVYQAVLQLPMAGVLAYADWVMPAIENLPWIIVFGIAGMTAHLGLAKALAIADITVVVPIDFLRLPIIGVIGYLFYTEPLEIWVFVGAIVIVGSNYYSLRAETRPAAH